MRRRPRCFIDRVAVDQLAPLGQQQRERHHRSRRDAGENEGEQHDENSREQGQARPQSVIAMARNARRSRAESFSLALLSWPQAARMSRPRGVRTGEAYPALKMISENCSILSQSEHSYLVPGHGLNGIRLIFAGMPLSSLTSALAS